MTTIQTEGLSKNYLISEKRPGFRGTLRHFLRRQERLVKAVSSVSFQIEKGEMVGEISYFDKKPRSASVFTVGRCELAIIPSDKFKKLFDELPSWSQALTKSLVKRVRNNNSQ